MASLRSIIDHSDNEIALIDIDQLNKESLMVILHGNILV